MDEKSGPLFECQNCRKKWKESELKPVRDVSQRVTAGEPFPAGECPECGALCHEEKAGEFNPEEAQPGPHPPRRSKGKTPEQRQLAELAQRVEAHEAADKKLSQENAQLKYELMVERTEHIATKSLVALWKGIALAAKAVGMGLRQPPKSFNELKAKVDQKL